MEERFYEEYARIQDEHWWFLGRRRIVGSLIAEELGMGAGSRRLLDVGCGTGTNLAELSRFGQVEGVDAEPAAVEISRRDGWVVQLVPGTELPFADASFDVVTLLDVIEHVPDDQVLLEEVRRILADDGIVVITVPAYTWMWGAQDVIAHHYRRYTRKRLIDSLDRAGFQTHRSTYFNSLLFPPIAAIRLLRRLRPESEGEVQSDFELSRPGAFNGVLTKIFSAEAWLLRRIRLPFGVSIVGFAHKR